VTLDLEGQNSQFETFVGVLLYTPTTSRSSGGATAPASLREVSERTISLGNERFKDGQFAESSLKFASTKMRKPEGRTYTISPSLVAAKGKPLAIQSGFLP